MAEATATTPKTNTTLAENVAGVREIDLATRFGNDMKLWADLMSTSRFEKKVPGTQLYIKRASVTLDTSEVKEGCLIPYSTASVTETSVGEITLKKYKKGTTFEAVAKHGFDSAIQMTDDELLRKIEGTIMTEWATFIQTGEIKATYKDFQKAVAMAQGLVEKKWEDMDKGYSEIIGFVNTLDAFQYLGTAQITTQNAFGMRYVENFLGFSKLFITSKVPSGKVVATPSENVIFYHVDPSDSDFAKAGLEFRTDGTTNLVGVHVGGNYATVVSEITAVLGVKILAEYLDGIAVVTVDPSASKEGVTGAA